MSKRDWRYKYKKLRDKKLLTSFLTSKLRLINELPITKENKLRINRKAIRAMNSFFSKYGGYGWKLSRSSDELIYKIDYAFSKFQRTQTLYIKLKID